MSLTLYTHPMSRGRIARWMMEELAQPYETVILDYASTMKAPAYLALNPMGKVPALVHDGQVITETAAIITYLADAFPEAGLMPSNRAAFFRWMFFGAGPVEQAVVNTAMGWIVPPERKAGFGYGSLDDVVATLAAHLDQSPYICGESFSAADVYLGSQVGWGLRFGTLPAHPAFQSYWDRLKSRPALAAANAKDDALMPKRT